MTSEPFGRHSLPLKRYLISLFAFSMPLAIALSILDFKLPSVTVLIPTFGAALLLEVVPARKIRPQNFGEIHLLSSLHLALIALFSFGVAIPVAFTACAFQTLVNRSEWRQMLLKSSASSLAIIGSGLTYRLLTQPHGGGPNPLAFALAALSYRALSSAVLAGAIKIHDGTPLLQALRSAFIDNGAFFVAQAFMGLTAVYLYGTRPIYAMIALIPLLMLLLLHAKAQRYFSEMQTAQSEFIKAGEVQRNLLPLVPVERDDMDVAFKYIPYSKVSGDFFDILQMENEVYLAIGDAMGKGVPAALVAASHHHSLRLLATRYDTAEILTYANSLVYDRTVPEAFLSMFCARYNVDDASLSWSNAGHPPPVFLNGRTGGCRLLTSGGIALGAKGDASYKEQTLFFSEDDILVLYTDGVIESLSEKKRQHYGIERMLTVISKNRHGSAERIAEAITESVLEFSGGRKHDDLTIVVLKGKTSAKARFKHRDIRWRDLPNEQKPAEAPTSRAR